MIVINALKRKDLGSLKSRRLRKDGFVPAIVFGLTSPQEAISVCAKTLSSVLKQKSFMTKVISLKIEEIETSSLIKDIQFHPVTGNVLHVDFIRVNDDTLVDIEIPLNFINEDKSPGMKLSGVLNIVKRKILVSCAVSKIPDQIDVDLTGSIGNSSIRTSSIILPKDVTLKIKSSCSNEFTIATIVAKRQKETA